MQLLILGTNCRLFKMRRIVAWDELSLGTNCRLGRIDAWDELSLGTNCRFTSVPNLFSNIFFPNVCFQICSRHYHCAVNEIDCEVQCCGSDWCNASSALMTHFSKLLPFTCFLLFSRTLHSLL